MSDDTRETDETLPTVDDLIEAADAVDHAGNLEVALCASECGAIDAVGTIRAIVREELDARNREAFARFERMWAEGGLSTSSGQVIPPPEESVVSVEEKPLHRVMTRDGPSVHVGPVALPTRGSEPRQCAHIARGGPCVRNPTVATADWCGPCKAAWDVLVYGQRSESPDLDRDGPGGKD